MTMESRSHVLDNSASLKANRGRSPRAWADWWAVVATAAERRGGKRVDHACVEELYPGFLRCCEAEADFIGRLEDFHSIESVTPSSDSTGVLFLMPTFGQREEYSLDKRQVVRVALDAARQAILPLMPRDQDNVPRAVRLPVLRNGLIVCVRNGKVAVAGSSSSFGDRHLVALVKLLMPGRPFLFARCPRCGRIFARSGRGLRCSTYCTGRVAEAKRQKTDKRRKQAREAMRKLRAKRAHERDSNVQKGE